jgi:hypothetical protein
LGWPAWRSPCRKGPLKSLTSFDIILCLLMAVGTARCHLDFFLLSFLLKNNLTWRHGVVVRFMPYWADIGALVREIESVQVVGCGYILVFFFTNSSGHPVNELKLIECLIGEIVIPIIMTAM